MLINHLQPENQPLHAYRPCLQFFCHHLLQQVDLKQAFGKHALETRVFLLQLLEALDFLDGHPAIGFAPAIERGFGNPMFATL